MLIKLKLFLRNRTNLILVLVLVFILGGLSLTGFKFFNGPEPELPVQEVDLPFDPEGPYALLTPRNDGNASMLNITRVASYDSISYELAYQSEGIDRGVQGNLDAKGKKGEYSQEILFGTCSQGFTTGAAHCVFDKNVENGTLTLKIKKPTQKDDKFVTVYKMVTTWHLQKPDVSLGVIISGDGHFTYKTAAKREDLAFIGWSVVNDLSGAPKLPEGKKILGKVYAFNLPTAKKFLKGEIAIELIDSPPQDVTIARYVESENNWEMLETKVSGNKLTAPTDGAGIFAVLIPGK